MGRSPGDGWVTCDQGHRHWGLYGAAGLLPTRVGRGGAREVLLQHRAAWTHQGDTWGLTGGARQPDESPVAAALREAREEVGLTPEAVRVSAVSSVEHGGWGYATVVADTLEDDPVHLEVAVAGHETETVAWVAEDDVDGMRLHPGFRAAWPHVRPALRRRRLVVDAANVVGSRPDGWWRDRVGATGRLVTAANGIAAHGLAAADAPWDSPRDLDRWYPEVLVVIEGTVARSEHRGLEPEHPAVTVVRSEPRESGDDAIMRTASLAEGPHITITADRELRQRLRAESVDAVGPSWFWDLVDEAGWLA